MRTLLIYLISCAVSFGATTISDGIVSSYYTEANGIYTYVYEVAAKPYSNKKLSTFTLSVSDPTITNVQISVSGNYNLTNTTLEFFGFMITNQQTVTLSFNSANPAAIAEAVANDTFQQQLHQVYIPVPEVDSFFLLLGSVGMFALFRRRSA